MPRPRHLIAVVLALAACGDDSGGGDPDAVGLPPTADPTRDIVDTTLAIDLGARDGVATIALAASTGPGASLEIGDLEIRGVTSGGVAVPFAIVADRLDLGVGPEPITVAIDYAWRFHEDSDGVDMDGFTLTWPYFCGNVFPCRSNPADGTTFHLAISGNATGTVVYPAVIPDQAPSYMAAWVVGDYVRTILGTTTAGTTVVVWAGPGEAAAATSGTEHLVAAFDWLEQHVGPYRFGSEVGTVAARWGASSYGGMEHHPLWHVAAAALGDESINVHEAAHGWFGDGIRVECWEDFTLSEGAATYYEARVVEEVGAAGAGAAAWAALDNELASMRASGGVGIARPDGCGSVDVLDLFTRVPYVKGAMFLRAVERRITRPTFDLVMRTFYTRFGGKAAGIADLVAVIQEISRYDATPCARDWLSVRAVPTALTCP